MIDRDHKLREQLGKEIDEILFVKLEMGESLMQKIRQEAALEKPVRRKWEAAKSWKIAAAGIVAAVLIAIAVPLLGQPSSQTPVGNTTENVQPGQSNDGAVGSEVSHLKTTTLRSVEEAKTAFGEGLRLPAVIPDGYTLTEMEAVGMPGQPARDILFTYNLGEQTVVFSASRMETAYPPELFTKTKVGNVEGVEFEQPNMTELYWTVDDVHYGIIGPISGDEAMKMAESAAL
ncbi:uncharacterized protein DUF4367 [Paenibacillus taihuensis]|uniref:Uncharacterized protein DUF4367 n=1 Tax=Paenibacillus taihuensis TaxID=1156355 RepID=A0A3D9QUG0_9BACL|nr:DUF4367 domain-containing protein [Paenibacillus taihuensis]REE67593.1 uncharacterized protein DUF4367 [Paenibacillus taihuensis]